MPDFSTPKNAIISLENAYTKENIDEVLLCKDFVSEAQILLKKTEFEPLDEDIIKETAELLKLSLIENIQNNGFPYFEHAKRLFSEVKKYEGFDDLYFLTEQITYEDSDLIYFNNVVLSFKENQWKIAYIEEVKDDQLGYDDLFDETQ